MDILDLARTQYYWAAFGGAAAALVGLRLMAAREAVNPYIHDHRHGLTFLRPIGPTGLAVGGSRLVLWGEPRARFFNPAAYLEFMCCEPSLLLWYVAGWYLLWQDWIAFSQWAGGAFAWRIFFDLVLGQLSAEQQKSRLWRTLLKCFWAATSGIYYAALTVVIICFVLLLLCAVALVAKNSGSRWRRFRRW